MPAGLFGITDDTLNLVVNLLVLFLVVVWFALIAWTYLDARRRIDDPVLVMCAAGASLLFPYVGTVVYSILRPPEFITDRRERELEIRASELRLRHLEEQSCPRCEHPIERTYLRCPSCRVRIKHPCESCQQPVDPRWSLCPYCESALRPPEPEQRPVRAPRGQAARPKREAQPARQPAASRERQARATQAGGGQGRTQGRPKRAAGRSAPETGQRQEGDRAGSSKARPKRRSGGDDEPRPAPAR